MKLSADQIRSVCMGASRVEETENGVRFLRFTKQQAELYKVTNADFYNKKMLCRKKQSILIILLSYCCQ